MGKQAKRTYKPLSVNNMTSSSAAPTLLGASNASKLATYLRNRQSSGQAQSTTSLRSEAFGPSLGSLSAAPSAKQDEQSSSWAQRARLINLKLALPDDSRACLQGFSGCASVAELKQRIQKEHGIRVDHQTLSFFGRRLENSASLIDSGIAAGALINVKFCSAEKSLPTALSDGYPTSGVQAGHQPIEQQPTSMNPAENKIMVSERQELSVRLFRSLDKDTDGFLNCEEMYILATLTGFDGSETEWAEEYRSLCAENGVDATVGVTCELLMQLINDDSDNGIHCTDDELRDMLQNL